MAIQVSLQPVGPNPHAGRFLRPIKRRIAVRAGYKCSRPECGAATSGPRLDKESDHLYLETGDFLLRPPFPRRPALRAQRR
jgi:hypothetical protein